MVFPLGMYAVATFMVAEVTGLTFLDSIAKLFTVIAVLAWAIVFIGLVHKTAQFLTGRS